MLHHSPYDRVFTADALLFDITAFPRPRECEAFPNAAGALELSVQFGQAMAVLNAFEVRHSLWSAEPDDIARHRAPEGLRPSCC